MSSWTSLTPSVCAQKTANPIRGIVDKITPNPNHPKSFLKLSIGDPTLDGNLLPPAVAVTAVQEAVASHKYDGYAPSFGLAETRKAIAEFWNENFNTESRPKKFDEHDVIATSGASQALEIAIGVFCDAGDVLLIPAPGFSLYGVICSSRGIVAERYQCLADKNWEIDLVALEKTISDIRASGKHLKAIVVNNPANPSGSNFSHAHVGELAALANRLHVPVIADEIYAGMTFNGTVFTSFTNFPETPALVVAGLAKSFVVPGWRLGWILKHDLVGAFDRIWAGCHALSQIIIGPNTLVQAAVPKILSNKETKQYREELAKTVGSQSALCFDLLSNAKGLKPIRPDGAMYMLVGIDVSEFDASWGVTDDVAFSVELMKEENVQVLPGTIFDIPGFFRIVVTKPPEQLKEAVERIVRFVATLKTPKQ